MHIQTSRFGTLQVNPEQIATFPCGIIGFHDLNRFVLLPSEDNVFFNWLHSVDDPDVGFLVTDPTLFFKEYAVAIREETQAQIQLEAGDVARTLVICNKVGDWLTGNLLGPIVLNEKNFLGHQVVLTEKKWTTRQPLSKLHVESRMAKAA
jgi:flagellar assembly factor FliW